MSLSDKLPDRPMKVEEMGMSVSRPGLDVVMPLFSAVDTQIVDEYNFIIGCVVMRKDRAEFVGFDPDEESWTSVTVMTNVNDPSGMPTGLRGFDDWIFEHYDTSDLVRMQTSFG